MYCIPSICSSDLVGSRVIMLHGKKAYPYGGLYYVQNTNDGLL